MKITFEKPGSALEFTCHPKAARPPYIQVDNWKCRCGSSKLVGKNQRSDGENATSADAFCVECESKVGMLRTEGMY